MASSETFAEIKDMSERKINTKDISVVVQGAVEEQATKKCLRSIRKQLPGAEIILSTWNGISAHDFDYDILVQSDDPGSIAWHFYGNRIAPVNYNRQLVSTKEGLARVTRKYAIKMRSDFYLKNASFLDAFEDFNHRRDGCRFFRHRVIVPAVYTRMFFPGSSFPSPFCVSDFFFFGLADDIRDYFSTEKISEEEGGGWHFAHPDRKPDRLETGRYMPEQFLCYGWTRRHGLECDFADCSDWGMESLAMSNEVLFNNFIVLDSSRLAIASAKHDLPQLERQRGLVTTDVFMQEYEKIFLMGEPLFCMERYAGYWKPLRRNILLRAATKIVRRFSWL